MKQPNIHIFGNTHKVREVAFNEEGVLEKVVYQVDEAFQVVFKHDYILNDNLSSKRKIQQPTKHPYFDYAHAPNLEALIR